MSRFKFVRPCAFDRRQIFRREWARVGEVVVETVFDRRADGDLRLGEQLLDGIGQQVRGGMADQLEAIGIAVGDDREFAVLVDREAGIDELAVDLAQQSAARARPAPMLCATSATVTACANSRFEPSGKVMTGIS